MALPTALTHFCLEQVPTFSHYLPYLAYDATHQLYLITKDTDPTHLAWGIVFECMPSPAPGEKQAMNLKGLFELLLPPGTTIQISAAGLQTEAIPYLLQYRAIRQTRFHADLANRRIQRLARLLMSGNQALQTAPLRNVVLLVSISIPITPVHDDWYSTLLHLGQAAFGHIDSSASQAAFAAIPTVARIATEVEQQLTQAFLAPRRIPPERLCSILYPILNPGHPYRTFDHVEPDRELRRQLVMADTQIVPHPDRVEIDGYHFRSISPLQFPPEYSIDRMEALHGDLFNTTQQIPASFLLTLNTVVYERIATQRNLHRKFAILSQQTIGPMARIIPRLGLKAEHFGFTMHALEQGHFPLSAYLHLALWAPTQAEANTAIAAAEAIWRAHNFTPQNDGPASLNLIRESLPLALSASPRYLERELCRGRTILSSNCASLAPIGGDWRGTGNPIMLMVSRRGQLACIDPFENPHGAYNAVVAGLSGGGKSVFCNDLLLGMTGTGAQVICIDKGKSYERLVTTLGGDYLLFDPEIRLNLNPFSFIDSLPEFEDRLSGLKALLAQMASPSRPITDYEDSLLGQALQQAYRAYGHDTTITHIAAILRENADARCQDLAQMLYPYTKDGEYARLFEGPATINVMTSRLLLLELEELSTRPKLQSVVFLALVLACQAAMERGDRATKKIVLIDEAWAFLTSKQAAQFVIEIVRRARKYAMSLVLVTQSLQDLINNEAGETILANTDLRVIFPHKPEALRDERLALSPCDTQLIRSLTKVSGKYSECFIRHPSGSMVARHIIDEFSYFLFSTQPNEVSRITRYIKEEGLSVTEAITRMIGEDTMGKQPPPNIVEALR